MTDVQPTDAELVERVLAGERALFHELVDRHATALHGALRTLVPAGEELAELFQETWVRALARLGELRDPARLRSWLVSIGLNLAREGGRRRRGRSLELLREEGGADPPDPGPEVGSALEQSELLERVRAELARLPERQRQVVGLRLAGELSHAQIAQRLGIAEDAARASYSLGMRRLRERLAGQLDPAQGGDRSPRRERPALGD